MKRYRPVTTTRRTGTVYSNSVHILALGPGSVVPARPCPRAGRVSVCIGAGRLEVRHQAQRICRHGQCVPMHNGGAGFDRL